MTDAEMYNKINRFKRDVLPSGELERLDGWSKSALQVAKEIEQQRDGNPNAGTVAKEGKKTK